MSTQISIKYSFSGMSKEATRFCSLLCNVDASWPKYCIGGHQLVNAQDTQNVNTWTLIYFKFGKGCAVKQ